MLLEELFESNKNSFEESKESKNFSQDVCEEEGKDQKKAIEWDEAHEWELYMLVKKRVEDQVVFSRTFHRSKQEALQHYKDNFHRIFKTCRKLQTNARLHEFKIQEKCLKNSLANHLFTFDKTTNSRSSSLQSIPQAEEARQSEEYVPTQKIVLEQQPKEQEEEVEDIPKLEKCIKTVSQTPRWSKSNELILILLWKMDMLETSITSKMLSYSAQDIKTYLNMHKSDLQHKFTKLIITFKMSPNQIKQLYNKNLSFLLQTFFQKQKDRQKQKKKTSNSQAPLPHSPSNFKFDLCFSEIEWKTFKK